MTKKLTGNEIRQTFIDFFVEHGHTAVPSMSLVPGGDNTFFTISEIGGRYESCNRASCAVPTGIPAK